MLVKNIFVISLELKTLAMVAGITMAGLNIKKSLKEYLEN
jgi:hypothetical protein